MISCAVSKAVQNRGGDSNHPIWRQVSFTIRMGSSLFTHGRHNKNARHHALRLPVSRSCLWYPISQKSPGHVMDCSEPLCELVILVLGPFVPWPCGLRVVALLCSHLVIWLPATVIGRTGLGLLGIDDSCAELPLVAIFSNSYAVHPWCCPIL